MVKFRTIVAVLSVIGLLIIQAYISYGKYVLEDELIAAELSIDRTKPVGEVNYETIEISKESTVVTVSLNEPIEEVDGWTLSEDKLTMAKIYNQNTTEEVKIVDLAGNENIVRIDLQN